MANDLLTFFDLYLNRALLFVTMIYFFLLGKEHIKSLQLRDFSANPSLTTVSFCLLITLAFYYIFSIATAFLYELDMTKNSKLCLYYTINTVLLLAYVTSFFIFHIKFKFPLHPLTGISCLVGCCLIVVQLIRFIDRLILETNVLADFHRWSGFLADFIVMGFLNGYVVLEILHQRKRKQEVSHE